MDPVDPRIRTDVGPREVIPTEFVTVILCPNAVRPRSVGDTLDRVDDRRSADHLNVLVYSSNSQSRRQVIDALGDRPTRDLPPVHVLEVATAQVVRDELAAGGIDLAILDAEAAPHGGMGLSRQIHDEIASPPPVLLLVSREQDRWLADWSEADAIVVRPIDPFALARTATEALRSRYELYDRLSRLASTAWSDN
jgi:DNA-binding response OmpR family regulator